MIKALVILCLILSSCGKKGQLSLEGEETDSIIQIDEERLYKF
tara:strand:+ start:532 stop:660 length:129 start_codon:yes stop_codon:yes gene_type:complete